MNERQNGLLINPTFEELLEWNMPHWDTLRLFVMNDFVVFASGLGWTHHDIVVQLKGNAKRYPDGLAAIAYYQFGKVKWCIDSEEDSSEASYRLLCKMNPDFATVMKDVVMLREQSTVG